MQNRRILVFTDYYVPGFKAGGTIRSVSGIVCSLRDRFQFFVLTRDRDFGDERPYRQDLGKRWHQIDGCRCRYLAPHELGFRSMRSAIRATPHDLQYANSLFSWPLSIKPILLRRLRLVPSRPLIVAPRGELDPGALALSPVRKRLYIGITRALHLYGSVVWHAANEDEAARIRRWFGGRACIHVAPDVVAVGDALDGEPEPLRGGPAGELRVAFMSRISPIKNLHGALEILAGVRAHVQFDVYGPLEDRAYWSLCKRVADALPPNVSFAYRGPISRDRVRTTLASYELFLFPTRGESFGHAIFEALSAGCPALISDCTPWRDLEAQEAGWDLPLEQPERFRTVIESHAAASPAERRRWTRGASRLAHAYAASDEGGQRTAELFETALTS